MDPIRYAVFGCGGMANGHATRMQQEPNVHLAACCDIVPEAAKAFAERHKIPAWYTDPQELLDKTPLDACSIVTSDAAHAPISLAAFKKGLHVLCEKPLGVSSEETRVMLKAARASGRMHMVNFSYRSYPALERARDLIAEGLVGRVMHVEASYLQSWLATDSWGDWRNKPAFLWRMSKKHRGGTLVDIGCHILIFTTLLAGNVRKLTCQTRCFDKGVPRNTWKGYKLDADDSFTMTAEFDTGALGVVHASRWATGHANALRLRVFGDKGAIVIDSESGKDKLQLCTGDFQRKHMMWNTLNVPAQETAIYSRFIRSIRSGKAEPPTFEDGHRIQVYLDACKASAESGRIVSIKE
jgi:predicted dehydrogenase